MSYRLFTDATADLPLDYVRAHDITVLPVPVMLGDENYEVGPDQSAPGNIDFHEYYQRLRAGADSKTAQVGLENLIKAFTPALEAGDDVIYSAFSSGLSGTCSSALLAAGMLKERFPQREVRVVDSLCASLGHGLLVHMMAQKKEEGASLDELEAYANDIKLKIHHWFTVDDLYHLKRGGRVSATSAFLGSMLNVKPVLNVDDEGHLIPKEKVQGRKRALKALVDHMADACEDPSRCGPVFLSHSDAPEDAALVARMIKQRFGVEVSILYYISPIIGCHTGTGTIALFFIGDKPRG